MPTPDRRCLLMNLNPTEPWTFLLLTSIHVAIGGGGCLFRTAPVLTRAQVRRVPVPPIMRAVRLLVAAVVLLRLLKKLCYRRHVCGRFPFPTGQPRFAFL